MLSGVERIQKPKVHLLNVLEIITDDGNLIIVTEGKWVDQQVFHWMLALY